MTVGPGTQIYTQNEFHTRYFILIEGTLEVYYKSKNNKKTQERSICTLNG